MQTVPNRASSYKVGGCLGFNHPTYVEREADRDLLEALKAGQFCYVFNCRQMGKSSLRVRAMHLLKTEGMRCAAVDMTSLGSNINPQQWYSGVIYQLFQGFELGGKVNLKSWLQERDRFSPVQKLSQFLEEVLLGSFPDQKFFIFIDEIDKVLSLNFSLDDFFALIRFCYNQRAENSAYENLTFALFGVATPSDLIEDKTQTLFNIGQAIELTGFNPIEALPLAQGLSPKAEAPQTVLREILSWTGGQPFLSQKLCQWVVSSESTIAAGQEAASIENLVRSRMILHWESQDEPVHFKTIRDRLLSKPERTSQLLGLYRTIWQQGYVPADNSPEQSELRLTGLVVKGQEHLRVYNRIYREIFDRRWIDRELKKLRPYAEAIAAWETSDRKDESRLLRGLALQDALHWADRNSLNDRDYQFLAASQDLDKRLALEAERRAMEFEKLGTQLELERRAKQKLALAYEKAKRRLRTAAAILIVSLLGAAISTTWLGYAVQKQKIAQDKALEWAGKSALKQFEFQQIDALLTAMEAGQELKASVKTAQPLQNYPATTPIAALQDILDNIREWNQLEGHQEGINGISVSGNGRRIATASRDGTAKLWDIRGKAIATFIGHQGDVYSVSFSPDSQWLATASKDGTAKIWNMQDKAIATLKGHQSDVYSVSFSKDGQTLATASRDGTAKLWNLKGKNLVTFVGHGGDVYSVSFSPNGDRLATASKDETVKLWDLQGNLQRTFEGHQGAVNSVSFSPDGTRLATASTDKTVKLWGLQGQLQETFEGHQGAVYDVSFNPNGKLLATASEDESVRLWNLKGQELGVLPGYKGAAYDTSFSPDGKLLATASREKFARLWNLQNNPLKEGPGVQNEVAALSTSADGTWTATALKSSEVLLENEKQGTLKTIKGHRSTIYTIAFSPDRQKLAVGFKDGTVNLWDLQGKLLAKFKGHKETIYGLSFSPDGQLLATASRDKTVRLWTLKGQLEQELKGHQDPVYSVSFSPDGRNLATASSDKTVKLWDLKGRLQQTFQGHHGPVHDVAFSPDGQLLATASSDETAKIWSLRGQLLRSFQHSSGLVFRVNFSPNGQLIATGEKDGAISVWDLEGNLISKFQGHQGLVDSVRFMPDGQLLTSSRNDDSIRRWQVQTSASEKLDRLLNRGCSWLDNYFYSHPKKRLSFCKSTFR
ncbi:AAA-like domain-containing protein [Altericista sp. CCNU0014]|uniref:WD40 domain-containing protein n=1 Tax=Altericista sp. CCNU0014 TaxID=3082949 RepID=UPI00384D6647